MQNNNIRNKDDIINKYKIKQETQQRKLKQSEKHTPVIRSKSKG